MIRLRARDGHELDAYLAKPSLDNASARARGGIVIAQEMYGVNAYLRSVCDFYAAKGYTTIAPALYDRKQRGLTYAYTKEDHDRAQQIYTAWNLDHALADLDAARAAIADAGRIAIIGFCWGGSLAWLSACRSDYAGAVSYYGSMIPDLANEPPRCPVIAHIGDKDTSLPPARVAIFCAAQPSVPVFIYEGAPHGFDNESRTERYHPAAHKLARERTLEFLEKHLGGDQPAR
jgi:carboxymethylenebutenolidase